MAPLTPPPAPPAPLLALALALLLLAPARAALAAAVPAPAPQDDADALDALDALGAAPSLLARLRQWEAPPAPGAAPGPSALGPAPGPGAGPAAELFDAMDAQALRAAAAAAAAARVKRTGAQSLSIVAPLDVLRQRLMNELNRRRMRELQGSRIQQNRQLLTSIGKRMGRRLSAPVDVWSSWEERMAEQA